MEIKTKSNKIISLLLGICVIGVIFLILSPNIIKRFNTINTSKEYINPIYGKYNAYEFHKNNLNKNEQILYREVLTASLIYKDEFTTKSKKLTDKDIEKVFLAVIYDHPEVFWLDSYKAYIGDKYTYLELTYEYSKEEAIKIDRDMQIIYKPIIKQAKKIDGIENKITFVHDELVKVGNYSSYSKNERHQFQSMVSIFTTGNTVCTGYTYAFKFIMDNLGINSINIEDISKRGTEEAHIWNAVYINNEWKYLDLTWDDKLQNTEYLLKNKDDFYKTHTLQENLPE